MDPASTHILIIGAGAFGMSTAHALSQRNYAHITVLDPYPYPSIDAAANDISKIIRSDYNEPLYARLGLEAIAAWSSDPLYSGLYRQDGWVLSAMERSLPFVRGSLETAKRLGVEVERLEREDVRRRWPVVKGNLDGWNECVWNPSAGWVEAGEALRRMGRDAEAKGVKFVTGRAVELLYDDGGRCVGAITSDGRVLRADAVVVAAGAWTPGLLDCKGQLTAKGHSVAHIQMDKGEAMRYDSFPIMDNLELGYFFPPQKDGIFKMAHSQFVVNTATDARTGITTSRPHTFVEHPKDDLPPVIESTMRRNLRRVLPELADRPFSFTRLCWDADTADRHFLITPHPEHQGLFIAAGGSAHGFKFLPVLGTYIADLLEGKLEHGIQDAWKWRPGQVVHKKDLAHMDPEVELPDLTGWSRRRVAKADSLQARL